MGKLAKNIIDFFKKLDDLLREDVPDYTASDNTPRDSSDRIEAETFGGPAAFRNGKKLVNSAEGGRGTKTQKGAIRVVHNNMEKELGE